MYKTILLHLVEDPSTTARIALARGLAERFGAALIGLVARPLPFVPAAFGEAAYVGPEIIEAQRAAAQAVAARLRAAFDAGLAGSGLVSSVIDEEGDEGSLVALHARAADLVIVGQSDAEGLEAMLRDVAEHAVMAAGVPVLSLPRKNVPTAFGRGLVVGWNGSREAARAIGDALPFLMAAQKVVLLAVGDEAGTTVEAAAARLRRHGIEPQVERLAEPEGEIGELLVTVVRTKGCDGLVVGAYGHTRLRELVLGGATRSLIRACPYPVLFSS